MALSGYTPPGRRLADAAPPESTLTDRPPPDKNYSDDLSLTIPSDRIFRVPEIGVLVMLGAGRVPLVNTLL